MPSHIELRRRLMARRRREQAAAQVAAHEQREREAQGAAQLLARLNNPPVPSGMAGIMERLRREGAAALAPIEDAPHHDDAVDAVSEILHAPEEVRELHPIPIEAAVSRLPPIIDDPFVPTPEQGEALEKIEQLKKLIGLRGFGSKRKALEQRLAKLIAELPANALPDDLRLARRPAITEMRVLDPAQAGAPGGTVLVQTVDCADPTRVAGEQTVQVRGAIDGRTLHVRPDVANFVTRRIYRPAHAPGHE